MTGLRIIVMGLILFIATGLALPYFLEDKTEVGNETANVTVVISVDYGQKILKTADMDPSLGLTAMEMLRNITDVETRYGGMFVYSMYGLKSDISKRVDWFYYVNGAYMDRGLASYRPKKGEVVQVDYHYWGSYSASPGFLSGYPSRLIHGLNGRKGNISIVVDSVYAKDATKLAKSLAALCHCDSSVVDLSETNLNDLEGNVIVIADPQSASFYLELQGLRKHAFWPSSFEEGKLWLNGLSREKRTELSEGYTIQCTDLPGGRWALMVFATDKEWLGDALRKLREGKSLGFVAAIAMTPSGTSPLPVMS